jgi:hypothetical protein
MATPGIIFELTEERKAYAIRYVEEGGLFKSRLADFMEISRPTLDRVLNENPDFFTSLKRANAVFCKTIIDLVKKKNPTFLLRSKYRDEFDDSIRLTNYDPQEQIKLMTELMDRDSDDDNEAAKTSTTT